MTIYLYKKTHNQTGLKYLGKTIQNPHTYKGSGKRWKPHIKKYGYDVTTEILRECQTKEEVKYWGVFYSKLWYVVESSEWANLRPEEGDGGKTVWGDNHPMKKDKHRNKARQCWTLEKRATQSTKSKEAASRRSVEQRLKITNKLKNSWRNDNSRKQELSARMVGDSNPAKKPAVIAKIAETKRKWAPEYKQEIINKTSGKNHYRNNPGYISTQIGHTHPRFNPNLLTFRNKKTGEIVNMTAFDFIKKFNLPQGNVSLVVNGFRKSVLGWELVTI